MLQPSPLNSAKTEPIVQRDHIPTLTVLQASIALLDQLIQSFAHLDITVLETVSTTTSAPMELIAMKDLNSQHSVQEELMVLETQKTSILNLAVMLAEEVFTLRLETTSALTVPLVMSALETPHLLPHKTY